MVERDNRLIGYLAPVAALGTLAGAKAITDEEDPARKTHRADLVEDLLEKGSDAYCSHPAEQTRGADQVALVRSTIHA